MKITFLDAKTVGKLSEIERLKELGELEVYQTTQPSETLKRIKDSDVVITNKVLIDEKIIRNSPKLALICVAATGLNNIHLDAAKEKGVEVKNVKGYSTDSVAQHTFAMLFHLMNHLTYYDKYVKSKKYSSQSLFTSLDREIFELKGKRFGIIGLGAIGTKVGELASVFGAEVVYFSTSGIHMDANFKRVELEELLRTCHVVSVHAPLNEKTKNLIGWSQFQMMKKQSVLLNTGRGGIINEKELVKALNNNLILGAAVDVFEKEPLGKTHPFFKTKNKEKLLLTPHIAWSSVEARKQLLNGIYHNITEFINSKKNLD